MYRNYNMYNDYSRQWGWGGGFGAPFLGGLLLGGLATSAFGGPWFYGGGYPTGFYGGPFFF